MVDDDGGGEPKVLRRVVVMGNEMANGQETGLTFESRENLFRVKVWLSTSAKLYWLPVNLPFFPHEIGKFEIQEAKSLGESCKQCQRLLGKLYDF